MREILFRGKRRDNGAWWYGFYLFLHVAGCDWTGQRRGSPEDVHFIVDDQNLNYAVLPETVGQYTGLKDKNGKRIFEGDVVRYYARQLGGEDVPVIQPVEYAEGGFCVHQYFLNNWLRNAANGNVQLEGVEVIGNIHATPI